MNKIVMYVDFIDVNFLFHSVLLFNGFFLCTQNIPIEMGSIKYAMIRVLANHF
jgi:hypothetical protein